MAAVWAEGPRGAGQEGCKGWKEPERPSEATLALCLCKENSREDGGGTGSLNRRREVGELRVQPGWGHGGGAYPRGGGKREVAVGPAGLEGESGRELGDGRVETSGLPRPRGHRDTTTLQFNSGTCQRGLG